MFAILAILTCCPPRLTRLPYLVYSFLSIPPYHLAHLPHRIYTLLLSGRIKELIITAGGENVPPVLIEDQMKAAMVAVSNCMVIGDYTFSQYTLSTHSLDISTFSWCTLSNIHSLDISYQHISHSIHSLNTPYQHTILTHPLYAPIQPNLSTHPINVPSIQFHHDIIR